MERAITARAILLFKPVTIYISSKQEIQFNTFLETQSCRFISRKNFVEKIRKVSNAKMGVGRGKTKKIDIDIISQRGGEQEEIGKLKVTECSDFKG